MPQAILLQDHEQLGTRGTVVDVSKGYLRNYLIPRKLAAPATKGAIAAAEKRREAQDRLLRLQVLGRGERRVGKRAGVAVGGRCAHRADHSKRAVGRTYVLSR